MTTAESTETIAVRLPKPLIERIDTLASEEQRTRSNFLARLLGRLVDDRPLLRILELIVDGISREEVASGDTYAQEYGRGQLHAAKWVISTLFGESRKDELLYAVRKTGRKIPHVVGRFEDGTRPGFDMDAG